jgi:hypothetical protein
MPTSRIALLLLTEIRDRDRIQKPYQTNEWKDFCERYNIPERSYHHAKRILERNHVIVKEKPGKLSINLAFASDLEQELIEWYQKSE